MNKQNFIPLFFFMMFVPLLTANSQSLTQKQTETITREVDAAFNEMIGYAEKLDYGRLNTGVDDTREAGFVTNNKYYPRFATLIDEMKSAAQGVDRQDINIREKKCTVLSENIVLLTATGVANATLTDGRVIPADFHWSFVYEKKGGAWKVIHSHQTTIR